MKNKEKQKSKPNSKPRSPVKKSSITEASANSDTTYHFDFGDESLLAHSTISIVTTSGQIHALNLESGVGSFTPTGLDAPFRLEVRSELGELLGLLKLDPSKKDKLYKIEAETLNISLSEFDKHADRFKRMKSQAKTLSHRFVSERMQLASGLINTKNAPSTTPYNASCRELKDVFERVSMKSEISLSGFKKALPTSETKMFEEIRKFEPTNDDPSLLEETQTRQTEHAETVENHIHKLVNRFITADNNLSRAEIVREFKQALIIAYARNSLSKVSGSGPSRDKNQLIHSLSTTVVPRAPSDIPAVYDHEVVHLALPSLISSPFEEMLERVLETKFRELWIDYKDERAWRIPEELPSYAQIDAMLSMAEGLVAQSETINRLREMGNLELTEQYYARFTAEQKTLLNVFLSEFESYTNISESSIRNITSVTYGGRLFYIIQSGDLNSSIVRRLDDDRLFILLQYEVELPPFSPVQSDDFFEISTENQINNYSAIFPRLNTQHVWQTDSREIYIVRLIDYNNALQQKIRALVSEAIEDVRHRDANSPITAESSIEALSLFLDSHQFRDPGDVTPSYPFKVFTPRSVNFGIKLDYRQLWIPLAYQAGDMVGTLPLLPGESRKYTNRTVIKKERREKELENSLRMLNQEISDTGRVESEIAKKAVRNKNFSSHAEASGSVGVYSFGGSIDVTKDAGSDINQTKKTLRESTRKAVNQFKRERKLEIEAATEETFEDEISGEIKNPNNELTLTALFFELQRRFFVTELLAEVVPIVAVAMYVPPPAKISESFLIQHDWILRQRLLDDSFDDAFELLKDTQLSRRIELGIRKRAVDRQLDALSETKLHLTTHTRKRDRALANLKRAVDQAADVSSGAEVGDTVANIMTGGLFGLFGGDSSNVIDENFRRKQEVAQEALQRMDREIDRLRSELEGSVGALDDAINAYSNVLRESLKREQQILRLRVHVAQNILHYMQAIWEFQIQDQQFLELYDVCTPILSSGPNATLKIQSWALLHEVADLTKLLGFEGNYLLFPLKRHNALTEAMASGYEEAVYPQNQLSDLLSGGAITEQVEYWIKEKIGEPSNEVKSAIEGGQVVVVPSGYTHVEALVGKHPLLEEFKQEHRKIDVRNALADTQNKEVEHLRRILRLLDDDLSDPEIVKNTLHLANEAVFGAPEP